MLDAMINPNNSDRKKARPVTNGEASAHASVDKTLAASHEPNDVTPAPGAHTTPLYHGLIRSFCEWLFGPIEYPSAAAERIRELATTGTVIYVARAHTSLLGLYFNHALARLGLPTARFIGGMLLLFWQPLVRVRGLWRHRAHTVQQLLYNSVLSGKPAFLFLRPQSRRRSRWLYDYLCVLIRAQKATETPLYVVPHVLVDREQSGAVRGAIGRRLFGSGRHSGRMRELWTLLFSPEHATVRVADAIDLRSLIAATPDADEAHLARRLAHALNYTIDEEQRVIAGPNLPAFEASQRNVLRSPGVRQTIAELTAQEQAKPAAWFERRAKRLFGEIAARYNVSYIRFMAWVVGLVFNRIYDGIVVDELGLERLLEAARKGPLVLCPSHKSHVDYLVMSYVLWQHDVTPPHIAAGANLSFFPMGSIFRRTGAFFLRRSFRGDALYRAVLDAYVAHLVRTGTSIECFVEGTRSRSGKLGMPKFGILGMVVDAWRAGARSDVQFVPVAIDYERIIEARSYERELLGAEKKSENIGALLRTTRVLRSRYGRVHVQFGEPVSLMDLAQTYGLEQSAAPELNEPWRRATERLGYRVLHSVAQACTVTPTSVAATALLGHRGRGLAESSFLSLGESITEFLDTSAARLSELLRTAETRRASLLDAAKKFVSEGAVTIDRAGRNDAEPFFRVREEWRIRLDFHKNAVMNYFAPASILARAMMRTQSSVHLQDELRESALFLSRLFKQEFLYRVDTSYTTHFDDALATLAMRALLDVHEDGTIVIRDHATMDHLASLLDSFVESYWITAQALTDLRQFPLWDKELAMRARERARRAFLEGLIHRPEAASRTLVESALGYMQSAGIVEAKAEGRRRRLQLTTAYEGAQLDDLITRIGSYL